MKLFTLISRPFALVVFFFISLSLLPSQDCLHDTIPPVLVCKDSVELRWGWCGNEMIYPSTFIQKVSDNCKLRVISFDSEGKILEMDILHFEINYGLSNTIPIYAHDTAGNITVCNVYFKVSDGTYFSSFKMNVNVLSDFWHEDLSHFKLGIQGHNHKVYWNLFDRYTGSQIDIFVGDFLEPKQFRIDVNEKKNPEKSIISSADIHFTIRHITGIQSYEGTINEINADMNEDGSIDIRDVKAQYDHILHWSPTDSIYKPKYKASFIESDGKPIADSIPYNANTAVQYTVSLDQLGNINRSMPFSSIPSQEPIVQFPGEIQYWDIKDIDCKKGQKYVLRFRNTDSSHFFAIQSGLEFNPEFLKVDSVYIAPLFTSKFYAKIYPDAVRSVFLNTSNPQIRSEFPEFYLVITAKNDFRLSEGFKASNSDMSRLKINFDGQLYPVDFRFNRFKTAEGEQAETKKFLVSPNPSKGLFQLDGYFPGVEQVELNVYDVISNLIIDKKVQLLSGILNESIRIDQEGLFYLILKEGSMVLVRERIVVNKN